LAHPAELIWDVLYAIEYSAPYRDDEIAIKWHAFSKPPNRKRRIEIFCDEYGIAVPENISQQVADMQRSVGATVQYLADSGAAFQQALIADGDLEAIEKRAKWSESQTF
jgi:hypothetical protein